MTFADDLKLARAGDTAAIARLFHRRRDYLRGLAKRILPPQLQPRIDQSDLIQDAFLKVIRGIHAFEGDSEETFDHWLATATRQACQDAIVHHLGTQKRNPDHAGPPDAEVILKPDGGHLREATYSTPSYHAQQNEQALRIAHAKSQLNDLQRLVITLRYEEMLSLREIAERLGKSEGQITGAWRRGLDKLSSLLVAERESGSAGT
jgi:RNA polymerase sigma-70 factor, ECF subfamily